MRPDQISLIISTYERPDALEQVLQGLRRQSDMPLEIFDRRRRLRPRHPRLDRPMAGSARRSVAPSLAARPGLPQNAHSQPGRRCGSKGDYIVLLDGDCVPHGKFMADHAALAEKNFWVQGRRCFVGKNSPRPFRAGSHAGLAMDAGRADHRAGQGPSPSFSGGAPQHRPARHHRLQHGILARGPCSPSMALTRNTPAGALGRTRTWARAFIIWAGRGNSFMAMPLFII